MKNRNGKGSKRRGKEKKGEELGKMNLEVV